MKPHLTREEFLHTQFIVDEFVSGVGKELQKKLESRAKNFRNWVRRTNLMESSHEWLMSHDQSHILIAVYGVIIFGVSLTSHS